MKAVIPILLALVAVAILFVVGGAWSDCEDQGGTLVRGVVWYECVSK